MRRSLPFVSWPVVFLLASLPTRGATATTAAEEFRPALLVMDIQNAYLPYMADEDRKFAMQGINGAIQLFRQRDLPIIRIYHTDPRFGPKPGSNDFEFPAEAMVKADDPKIVKNHPSAFKKTDLHQLLKKRRINAVFLVGLSATGCVLATYFSARELDYETFMVKSSLLSPKAVYTDMIEDISRSIDHAALRLLLQHGRK